MSLLKSHKHKEVMKHLERALDGQNKFWKYLIMALAVVVGGNLIGGIPFIIFAIIAMLKDGSLSTLSNGMPDLSAFGLHSSVSLALMLFVFAVMLLTFALLIKPMHRRTLVETINGRKKIRWNRIYMGIFVWGAILVASFIVSLIVSPQDLEWQFNLWPFLSLTLVALLLFPFQTTFEEVFFRGYLAHGIASWTRNRWAVLLIVSLLFALMHIGNPEVKEFGFWLYMPQYLVLGLFLGLISILDDGIELAIGAHFVNNTLAALVATHDAAALQTDALFRITHLDPKVDLIALFIFSALATLIFGRIYKWDFGIFRKKIEREQ